MHEIKWFIEEKIWYIMSIHDYMSYNYPILYSILMLPLFLIVIFLIKFILRKIFNVNKVKPSNNNDVNTTYTTNMPYENTQYNNQTLNNDVYYEVDSIKNDSIDSQQVDAILVGKKKKSKLVSKSKVYESLFGLIVLISFIIFVAYRYNEMKTLYDNGEIDSFEILDIILYIFDPLVG